MEGNFKRFLRSFVIFFIAISLFTSFSINAAQAVEPQIGQVKNVIVLVFDGTGSTHTTLARWYKGSPLALDQMIVGGVRTYSAESVITDSAPAATAFATGYKSNTKLISVLPSKVTMPGVPVIKEEDKLKPVATVLEGAKMLGKSTGLIATSNIQHATPAAFSSHWPDRNNYNEIAEQQVYQNIDVVLGGGKKFLLPKNLGGVRDDGDNLLEELRKIGYQFVENSEQMFSAKGPKLWGAFASEAMAYDMDRANTSEPSVAQMTGKAINILKENPKGFFLFVEGSKVDWASHANDPIGVISDVLAFDQAVSVALEFAKKDKNTLVIAFADHSNGGMSIGNKNSNKTYDTTSLSTLLDPLKKAKLTGEGLERKLNADRSNIIDVMNRYYGVSDLSKDEIAAIKDAKPGTLNAVVGPILSKRSIIGWTTTGHSGEDVFLYAYGPGKPSGLIENTEIAKIVATKLGFELNALNKKLFVDAQEALTGIGAKLSIDKTDPANPVVLMEKGKTKAELPASTNIVRINGKAYKVGGLILCINEKVYLPQEAIDIFKKSIK